MIWIMFIAFVAGFLIGLIVFLSVVAFRRSRKLGKHEFSARSMPDLYVDKKLMDSGRSDNAISGFKDLDDKED